MQNRIVPEGYLRRPIAGGTLVLRSEYAAALLAQGVDDPARLVRQTGTHTGPAGRGRVAVIDLRELPGRQMLIRPYLRGGLLGRLNRDLYFGAARPLAELRITTTAARQGIPVPDILGAVSIRAAGPLYRGYLISRVLPGCLDLPAIISTLDLRTADGRHTLKTLITAAAGVIRHMHAAGLYHGDLNLKNILADTRDPRSLHIIDWDKSYAKPALSLSERRRNVVRLCRSMRKFMRAGLGLTDRHIRLFLASYWQEPPPDGGPHTARCLRQLQRATLLRALFRTRPETS